MRNITFPKPGGYTFLQPSILIFTLIPYSKMGKAGTLLHELISTPVTFTLANFTSALLIYHYFLNTPRTCCLHGLCTCCPLSKISSSQFPVCKVFRLVGMTTCAWQKVILVAYFGILPKQNLSQLSEFIQEGTSGISVRKWESKTGKAANERCVIKPVSTVGLIPLWNSGQSTISRGEGGWGVH